MVYRAHMCGVVGVIGSPEASKEAFLSLTALQHRGQDAAGILTYDQSGFHRVRNLGLVESVFSREGMETLTGSMAIGHTRYSTAGRGEIMDVQPLLLNFPFGMGMVHNGNLVNVDELSSELMKQSRRRLLTRSDTEIVLNLLADELAKAPLADGDSQEFFEALCSAVTTIQNKVNGSYSIVALIADRGVLGFRDPHGIRPLVWGKRERAGSVSHMLCSESAPMEFQGYEVERNIAPGELIFVDMSGRVFTRVLKSQPQKNCMFEWVYFASPESVIDQVPVYGTRLELGRSLGATIQKQMVQGKIRPDVIIPVPETSRIAAIALAEELKIPYRELLIKNRYIKRTFILDTQEKRQKAVSLKLSPVRSEIKGKRVLLVDDSIVRGTTSKKIIDLIRNAGAKEVYFVSTCPPIRFPCFYGIDFPDVDELIASGRDLSAIEKELGADAVVYQELEGLGQALSRASGKEIQGKICQACLDGRYPTDVSCSKRFTETRTEDRRAQEGRS